jgi:tRNA A37 methylthiotransferase MiaB
MNTTTNKFGTGEIYAKEDLKGKTYALCCACMSIFAEFQSYANAYPDRVTLNPYEADNIVLLSCQVTDLAVLNDISTLEGLIKEFPSKTFYIGGCLAYRFDVPLPKGVRRLSHVRQDYQQIKENLVDYKKPFWVTDYDEKDSEYSDGHLFRLKYPLRIGVGCKNKCAYCTIRVTRGEAYEIDIEKAKKEFNDNNDILLISDAPTAKQITDWCNLAIENHKRISIRNVEPTVALEVFDKLLETASKGLLKEFHSPVQHTNPEVLKDMFRDVNSTLKLLERLQELKALGVFLATNIIIDYKDFPNPSESLLKAVFDYVSWNPYWDGVWDREKAEKKFKRYFGKSVS